MKEDCAFLYNPRTAIEFCSIFKKNYNCENCNSYLNKRFTEPYKHHESYALDFLRNSDIKNVNNVNMVGAVRTLTDIKEFIDKIFTSVSYMDYDIGFHGWSGDAADNLHTVRDELVKRMVEINIICSKALGIQLFDVEKYDKEI